MVAAVLVVLTLVLFTAACLVGVLLLRRIRSAPADPVGSSGTVGELVRRRAEAPDVEPPAGASRAAGDGAGATSAPLPAPAVPGTAGARPATTAGGDVEAGHVEVGDVGSGAGTGDVEVGDAPWRRAARMMGSEPGGGWDTAPVPVVPVEQAVVGRASPGSTGEEPGPAGSRPSAPAGASTRAPLGDDRAEPGTRPSVDAAPPVLAASPVPPVVDGGSSAGSTTPARFDTVAVPDEGAGGPASPGGTAAHDGVAASTDGTGADVPAPAVVPVPAVLAAPVVVAPSPDDAAERGPGPEAVAVDRPVPAPRTEADAAPVAAAAAAPAVDVPVEPGGQAAEPGVDAPTPPFGSIRVAAPSRPLSDPDLTPFMGIPVVRPTAVDELTSAPAAAVDPAPAPPPRSRPFPRDDDEVVSLVPATPAAARPVVGGTPQPVWFRVVRRDGAPVEDALVALLDDSGQEADATKTAADGGGELRAPHAGWFLMIASAEGFQPRAVTLEVDERPVEIALLLPRSSRVAGAVRDGGMPVAGAYVVALQEGEIADEMLADRDGSYRFDDLAEGVYALSATSADGCTGHRITLSEGADLVVDLDLTPPGDVH